MISFREYLNEATSKCVVAAFGRMQPPTIGHGLLVKKVVDTGKANRCDHIIYLSKTQDPKKNPLNITDKVKWAREMFPGANITGATAEIRTFIEMVKHLNQKYKVLYLVAGSDRVSEYQALLDKYNGTEFKYDKIEVVSAGERDPDADGASGMSATKMRNAAKDNDLVSFKKGLPTHMNTRAQAMMDDIRSGMKIKD